MQHVRSARHSHHWFDLTIGKLNGTGTKWKPGGGIIGCTTAYFLTRHPRYDPSKHRITILEASKIAGGASGKAGGLLALWGTKMIVLI